MLIEAEEAYFQGQIQEEPETISSPKQGYFMRTIDGLENMVDLKELDELTPESRSFWTFPASDSL